MGMLLALLFFVAPVPMEQVHERTEKDEDEWHVGEDVLPVIDKGDNHYDREEKVEPVRNTESFHGKGEKSYGRTVN